MWIVQFNYVISILFCHIYVVGCIQIYQIVFTELAFTTSSEQTVIVCWRIFDILEMRYSIRKQTGVLDSFVKGEIVYISVVADQ
jgi:hypothetical protein